ncbi:protein RER1A-like [Mercurialis annua]|uniref:protein RER1A-like n=1 Tax=Mercurialis annua TaxID=3986 RepID=UPI002160242C|nr:protein RER1A-like [Mercurialis annua]
MEAGQPGGGGEDGLSSLSQTPATVISRWTFTVSQRYQHLLDKAVPHTLYRWIGCLVVALIYTLRVYLVQGYYIITYGLGIYMLNLLIAFLSPQIDPALMMNNGNGNDDGPTLPTRGSDEFRPFVRRLPEFKFWYSIVKAVCIAFFLTFFEAFDVPVFWPILLFYWIILVFMTMRRQIMHMIRYKYVPFTFGKQKYGKKAPTTDSISIPKE